jgi:hypothetical protein
VANLRDLLDAAAYDRLQALASENSTASPDAVSGTVAVPRDEASRRGRVSESGHVPLPRSQSARSATRSRPHQNLDALPQRRIEKVRQQIDDVERRLGELIVLTQRSPGPHLLFVARTKHELIRDITAAKKRLATIKTSSGGGKREVARTVARAREVESRIRGFVIIDPRPAPSPVRGRALLPPRPLPPTTPGPDSPNYYQDPVNSK